MNANIPISSTDETAFSEAVQIDRRGLLRGLAVMPAAAAMPAAVAPASFPASATVTADPIFAAIEACRVAVVEFEKAVLAVDSLDQPLQRARVKVGMELHPNGQSYPAYARTDDEIARRAPGTLIGAMRESWIADRIAELDAEERRITKRRLQTKVGKLEVARNKAYDTKLAIEWDLIWTMPTTAAGLAALLRFCREMGSINELIGEDELEDVLEWTMECAACALAGLPKPPMSDLVAWNWANPYKTSEQDETGVLS